MSLKRTLLGYVPTATNRMCWAAGWFTRRTLTPEVLGRIEKIPGCLNRQQGELLYYLSAHGQAAGLAATPQACASPYPAEHEQPEGCVVEIGSFMGRSTIWLAHGVQYMGEGCVIAIDPHTGHERPDVHRELDSYDAFLRNISDGGVAEVVRPVRKPSQEVAESWSEPIRLLWVDGSHDYQDVLADLEGFAQHVTAGGYVALHDTKGRKFPGVKRAMLEYFAQQPTFKRIISLRNMAVYERTAANPNC